MTTPGTNTLNPDGDLVGDGYPTHDQALGRQLVAWLRPATSTLETAVGTSTWQRLPSLPTTDAFGLPRVEGYGANWLISWNEDPLDPRVRTAGVLAGGQRTATVELARGFLAGTVVQGDTLHVIAVEPLASRTRGTLALHTIELGVMAPITPIAIERSIRVDLDTNVMVPIIPLPISGDRSVSPTPGRGRELGSRRATIPSLGKLVSGIRTHEGVRDDGSSFAVLCWWKSPTTLAYLELVPSGAIFPVQELAGSTPYDAELVAAGIDDVSEHTP
ncbi:MAG: hypothetical protein AAF533_10785 [Acidobacteriota bacterium]